ncbi:MAG: YbgA family protein [Pseudomonadales bacterium]
MSDSKLVLGLSGCLAGQEVRYDGASKRFKLREKLQETFEFRPFCPEVAIGLGVPRKTLRLVGEQHNPQVIESDGTLNVTAKLQQYAVRVARSIEDSSPMCGFIVCKGSPSCGMEGVKRYSEEGNVLGHDTSGAFTAELVRRLPYLPVEEDGRLNDRGLFENFLTRVFALQRWRAMESQGFTASGLLDFHRRHKFLLLAHDQNAYRSLGPKLANLATADISALAEEYIVEFMAGMRNVPTQGQHCNTLMHLQGYVKNALKPREREELADAISAYGNSELPRHAPMTLLKHHLLNHPNEYAESQYYLDPFPRNILVERY